MKLRIEPHGYHFFDRNSGLHFLLDEIDTSKETHSSSPRTISIAITNDCNANCKFCHVPKGNTYLNKDFVISFCKTIDRLGTFDIAIGGGEPLLHKDFIEICKTIWSETELGISITTNGQLINEHLVDEIKDYISFMRISVDTVKHERYKQIRNYNFIDLENNIQKLKDKIPFGINMVIDSNTIYELDEMKDFAKSIGSEEILLLPIIKNNKFQFDKTEWKKLEIWINNNFEDFPLRILEYARGYMDIPVLFSDDNYYSDYLYLSPERILKKTSYSSGGKKLEIDNITDTLIEMKKCTA